MLFVFLLSWCSNEVTASNVPQDVIVFEKSGLARDLKIYGIK